MAGSVDGRAGPGKGKGISEEMAGTSGQVGGT